MKYKVIKALAITKAWANTEKGENTLLTIFSILCTILVVDAFTFILGLPL